MTAKDSRDVLNQLERLLTRNAHATRLIVDQDGKAGFRISVKTQPGTTAECHVCNGEGPTLVAALTELIADDHNTIERAVHQAEKTLMQLRRKLQDSEGMK